MHFLLFAASLAAASSPPQAVAPRSIAECTAERLEHFAGPFGVAQPWPRMQALPQHLYPQAGVVLAEPGEIMDGYRVVLHVDEARRSAYVLQQGGIAGATTVFGPLPVAACPAPAL